MSKADVTDHFAVENLLPEHNLQNLLPIIKSKHVAQMSTITRQCAI